MSVTIIAEVGINHNGDIELAKKLIAVAATAGCDVVKFQKRNPEVCVPQAQRDIVRTTPWGEMTYIDYKHKIEFGKEEYDEINRYCQFMGIDWAVSVWDLDSLEFIRDYDVSLLKIPSAMITDHTLLRACKDFGKPLVLSTGMSTLGEIDAAMEVLGQPQDFVLLHCNSTYPTRVRDINLRCINTLRDRYDCEVGYSGHEYGLTTTMASVCFGATVIERHVTLDHTMWGTDQSCSVEPHGLFKLVKGIRDVETALGDGIKVVTEDEKLIRKKLRQ